MDTAAAPTEDLAEELLERVGQLQEALDSAEDSATRRLARELGLSRRQLHTLRQRVQNNLYETLPTTPMSDPVFEADELYQNAGEKGEIAPRSHRSTAAPRQ